MDTGKLVMFGIGGWLLYNWWQSQQQQQAAAAQPALSTPGAWQSSQTPAMQPLPSSAAPQSSPAATAPISPAMDMLNTLSGGSIQGAPDNQVLNPLPGITNTPFSVSKPVQPASTQPFSVTKPNPAPVAIAPMGNQTPGLMLNGQPGRVVKTISNVIPPNLAPGAGGNIAVYTNPEP